MNWVNFRSDFAMMTAPETLSLLLLLALITRPPDGVLLAPLALAARRLRRLASLLEL